MDARDTGKTYEFYQVVGLLWLDKHTFKVVFRNSFGLFKLLKPYLNGL